jgi:urease accessory protein
VHGGSAALTSADIVAANRARGAIALSVGVSEGITRRARVHEAGSWRVRFPGSPAAELEAVLVNTAGGLAGGDRLTMDVSVAESANLVVTSAAAEKVYRSDGADTAIAINLVVGTGGSLTWLPQETILFDRSSLDRRIDISLADNASLLMAEAFVFGRAAMGESVREGRLIDRRRVRCNGQLIFAESLRLDGAIAEHLRERAVAAGKRAVANVLSIPGSDAGVAAVRMLAPQYAGEVGVSTWNGLVLVRLCAGDSAALRHDLVLVLAALGRSALPRLWLN